MMPFVVSTQARGRSWKTNSGGNCTIAEGDSQARCAREKFSVEDIVRVWFWAVVHDRPVFWATLKTNWPIHERRRRLPSSSTMSRRLRDPEVQGLITVLEQTVFEPSDNKPLVWVIDGKPLLVSGASGDRQAGFGRAQRCNARGYKLHLIQGIDGFVAASLGRRRAAELFDNPNPRFARDLMLLRNTIERSLANLTNWGGGLTHLPPWVRTHRRVHRWVQAKLILNAIKRASTRTYVNS